MKRLLPLLALGLASAASAADLPVDPNEWFLAGQSAQSLMFLLPDPSSAENARYPRVFVRFEEAKPFDRNDFASMSNVEVDEVDCANQRTRVLQNTRYSERNLMGVEHVEQEDMPAWRTEEKGSFGAAILSAVCDNDDEPALGA